MKTLESQVGQFLLGCKCQVSRGIIAQEQDIPAAFFLQDVLQLHLQKRVNLRVDSSTLWKIINEGDAVMVPKNLGENISCVLLHSVFFVSERCELLCRH